MTRFSLVGLAALTIMACGGEQSICPSGTELREGRCVTSDAGPDAACTDETCNGVDDDCDGEVDEADPSVGGACGSSERDCVPGIYACTDGELVCERDEPVGDEICNGADDDCDGEVDEGVEPTSEICNEIDDDCDGVVDEESIRTFFLDTDGDGHGDPERAMEGCEAPDGYVEAGDDCDDTCDVCWTGADEVCDRFDNDCDDDVDEGVLTTFYPDDDRDRWGTERGAIQRCESPGAAWAERPGDCNDASRQYHPEADFVSSGVDDYNCDGELTPANTRWKVRTQPDCEPADCEGLTFWWTGYWEVSTDLTFEPECGEEETFVWCGEDAEGNCTFAMRLDRPQECR